MAASSHMSRVSSTSGTVLKSRRSLRRDRRVPSSATVAAPAAAGSAAAAVRLAASAAVNPESARRVNMAAPLSFRKVYREPRSEQTQGFEAGMAAAADHQM